MNTPPQAWLKRRPTRRSHGLMRWAMLAISASVATSIAANVPAMTTNWTKRLRAGSMNWGRKAAKKRSPLGLVNAESAPCWKSDQRDRISAEASTSKPIGGERQTWTPSQTR